MQLHESAVRDKIPSGVNFCTSTAILRPAGHFISSSCLKKNIDKRNDEVSLLLKHEEEDET